ncbi:MAG: hypothetical protein BWK79_02690 [Beggiatoa sp. IS2]|nr:MAG: hypothetical protein BWK79_02690 [Beggiatoa sp. IS2]
MTDFAGIIWAVQDNDDVNFVCTTKHASNKIQVLNEKGHEQRIAEDKMLWQHPSCVQNAEEWQKTAKNIQTAVNKLRSVIDILLLWESALELGISEINELADLYFGGDITTEHLVAIWRVLAEERLHFKRRGKTWEPRPLSQVTELQAQRELEQTRTKARTLATQWLQLAVKSVLANPEKGSSPAIEDTTDIRPFVERLENWLLRGEIDKEVDNLIKNPAETAKLSPRELVFEILYKMARLSPTVDRDLVIAGLQATFPDTVKAAAEAMAPLAFAETHPITDLLCSIDDEDTREVDDAIAIERTDDGWQITIAISDPASLVHKGDILDREAMKRGTTVYLPTQTVLMLPERVSCDLASLSVAQVHSAIVIRAWLDNDGHLLRSRINREAIRVQRRLHYGEADALIVDGTDETAEQLRTLLTLANQLNAQRTQTGAFTLQRPEFKIYVADGTITITVIDTQSPSRRLIAEMMILANRIAAEYAGQHQVPIIYRTQDAPLEPITSDVRADPLFSYRVRKLMRPSTLSLQPAPHAGLGLSTYTQLTSPLRRFADLVMQRQLVAHLVGESLPYNQEELFKVLATAERTARDAHRFENDAKKRWLLEYLRQQRDKPIIALILEPTAGGYRVEMQPWGIDAFLSTTETLELGTTVTAVADKIRVKVLSTRLKLAPRHLHTPTDLP